MYFEENWLHSYEICTAYSKTLTSNTIFLFVMKMSIFKDLFELILVWNTIHFLNNREVTSNLLRWNLLRICKCKAGITVTHKAIGVKVIESKKNGSTRMNKFGQCAISEWESKSFSPTFSYFPMQRWFSGLKYKF